MNTSENLIKVTEHFIQNTQYDGVHAHTLTRVTEIPRPSCKTHSWSSRGHGLQLRNPASFLNTHHNIDEVLDQCYTI